MNYCYYRIDLSTPPSPFLIVASIITLIVTAYHYVDDNRKKREKNVSKQINNRSWRIITHYRERVAADQ